MTLRQCLVLIVFLCTFCIPAHLQPNVCSQCPNCPLSIVEPANSTVHPHFQHITFKISIPHCPQSCDGECSSKQAKLVEDHELFSQEGGPDLLVYVNGRPIEPVQIAFSRQDGLWTWDYMPGEFPEMLFVEMCLAHQSAGPDTHQGPWQAVWISTVLDEIQVTIQDVLYSPSTSNPDFGDLSVVCSLKPSIPSTRLSSPSCQAEGVLILEINEVLQAEELVSLCLRDEARQVMATIRSEALIHQATHCNISVSFEPLDAKPKEAMQSAFTPLYVDKVKVRNLTTGATAWDRSSNHFSTYQCIPGVEIARMGTTGSRYPSYPYASCMLRDVCWHNKAVEYYSDLAEESEMAGLSIFGHTKGLVLVPPVESKMQKHRNVEPVFWGPQGPFFNRFHQWSPTVKPHPLWADLAYSPREVVALDMVGNAYNFGHFIIDQVLPTLIALEAFGLGGLEHDVQLVMRWSCGDFSHIFDHVHGATPQPKHRLCRRNYFEWLQQYFLNFPPIVLTNPAGEAADGLCFRRMLVGHNMGFSQLMQPHNLFAPAAQRLRDRVLHRVRFLPRAPGDARDHGVLVLMKQEGWMTSGLWPSVCGDVQDELRRMGMTVEQEVDAAADEWRAMTSSHGSAPHVNLRCVDPASLALEAQVRLAASATTVVTLHGTVSFLVLFAPDGASALVAGKPDIINGVLTLKEKEALLTLSTVFVLYLNLNVDLPHLRSFLLRCLRHSAVQFGLWRI